jgi:hypothetical protein
LFDCFFFKPQVIEKEHCAEHPSFSLTNQTIAARLNSLGIENRCPMKSWKCFVLLFCVAVSGRAQDADFRHKVVYMELFGNTLYSASVNFENVIGNRGNISYGYRVGAGAYVPEEGSLALPLGLFAFTGKRNSHFEVATGISLLHEVINEYSFENLPLFESTFLVVPLSIAYRFQKRDEGLFFRLSLNGGLPVYEFSGNASSQTVWPSFGVAVGSTL